MAVAQIAAADWTPAQNSRITVRQDALEATHIASVALGLLPGPFGTPAEVAALSADIALKTTPATLRPPGDRGFDTNSQVPGTNAPYSCVYKFRTTIPTANLIPGGIEANSSSIFFITYDPVENVWSDLGRPSVYHPQADIEVTAENPYLGVGLPVFPEGHHTLDWRASTSLNYVMDVALPGVLIPAFAYAEHQLAAKFAAKNVAKLGAKSAAKAAKKTAENIFSVVKLAKEAGLIAANVSSVANANQWYKDTSVITAVNRGSQTFTVWDSHVPYLRDPQTGAVGISSQNVQFEATDFGGVRFGHVADALRARFEPIDGCGKSFETWTDTPSSFLLNTGATSNITWKAREIDGGPYAPTAALGTNQTRDGENVITSLVQNVTVVDTQAPILVPPPGFARYSSSSVDLTSAAFPLGRPLVVDLADPAPVVTHSGPDVLDVDHRYEIQWRATDSSGNSTAALPSNPDQYAQVVTIKSPGTNTPPTGDPKSAATLTSKAVEIELTGTDTDLLDGRVDPLAFEIKDYPAHGQFEAPLLPYFIEDFRLSPVGDRDNEQTLTRTSPLGDLADAFRVESPVNHGTFLTEQICNAPAGSALESEFHHTIPVNFVYQPTYVYVDDEGYYYVRDKFWVCGEPSNNGDSRPTMSPIPRISKWTNDGHLVAMRPLFPTLSPDYSDENLNTNLWPTDDFSVGHDGRIWVQFSAIFTTFAQSLTFYSFDRDLGDMRFHGTAGYDEQELIEGDRVVGVAGDTQLDLLYELSRVGPCGTFPQPACDPTKVPLLVRRANVDVDLTKTDGVIGSLDVSSVQSFNGSDIKLDSQGNVYVLDAAGNRVHKFSPTVRNDAGVWELGHYLGWMGSCTANLLDPNGVPYNNCDEQLGVSRGYSCTDQTCARATDTSGAERGRFNAPGSIEIDPHDILYIADTGNSRVQRFGPDGTFAGEAKSTGTGVSQGDQPGFILGNMGRPKQLAVNSSSFYVMELDPQSADDFVHVFKTLPFYDVTDASAKVKYVSRFDFQGTDSFTYVTNDGIDRSAPAPVSVDVSRAFRPPERLQSQCFADDTLATEIPCSLPEDGDLVIRFSAYDPDGFLSTGGLDRLTFDVLEQPKHGTLTLLSTEDNAAVYRYKPAPDYNGPDGLSFDAFDGVAKSADNKAVTVTVEPRPDPVTIEFPGDFVAARGFQRAFTANYEDIDADDVSDPEIVSLSWGDGATATGPAWAGSGRRDLNGREIDPQQGLGTASGMIIGSHTYGSTGNYALQVTMANAPAENLPNTTASANVHVIEATVVGSSLATPTGPVEPDTPFPLAIAVTNYAPQAWAGLTAAGTMLTITVPDGLTLGSLDSRCAAGQPIVCTIGDLAPGASATLSFDALIGLAAARENSDYMLMLEITDTGPHIQDKNVGSATISVADEDQDGVIDVDDAFPTDARYSVDGDGDGLADEWETAHGFNPNVADDTSSDSDGDGFTLAEEFANGSSPLLAEKQTESAGLKLEAPTTGADDRFGQALAGGDLDNDGYADTVIGAPQSGGSGSVFIAYGSANGADPSLVDTEIKPPAGTTQFGRSLAVGDFDGNGYPDVAIGDSNGISIHFNNGAILAAPDVVLSGTSGENLGVFLATGDLDGDGKADLVATAKPSGANGNVRVYLSSRGGFATPPLTFTSASANLVDSALIADVDGDHANDLLVGAASTSQVQVFLARDNDWTSTGAPTTSFVLPSPGPATFGYSLASGDIGGDGIADLVVGAYSGAGRVYVYDSATAYWQTPHVGDASTVPPSQTINGLDGGTQAGDGFGDQLGVRVAVGKLDTDSYADLVVGANRAGLADAGQVQIFHGGPTGLQSNPQVVQGATDRDMLGYFVAIPGDINGDGFDDVVAGAPEISTPQNPAPTGGYVQTYYHAFAAVDPSQDPDNDGVATPVDNCPNDANTDQGDLDGDGAGNVCDSDADGDGFANDFDNCPLLASSDQTNSDDDALGDLCDDDDDNDGVLDVDDAFPKDPRYSKDSDGDGLPDEYETANGLNPSDPADASADLDGDGRSNLDEFLAGSDIAADDVAPVVTAPAAVVADSIGPYSQVALGTATALDAKDGALTAFVDDAGPYAPGRHVLVWHATDTAGNVGTATQQVDVIPRVDFVGASQLTAEGAVTTVTATLNGAAVTYPVSVPYTIGGTATNGSDYSVTGTLDIASGTSSSLTLAIAADGLAEGEETAVFTMGTPSNAVRGETTEHTVRIVEGNLPPRLGLTIAQAGVPRATIVAGDGPVTMTLDITDPNVADAHTVDWAGTDSALVPSEGFGARTFTFDASGLADGAYAVRVTATDDGNPSASASLARLIHVVTARPILSPGVDSDGDGDDDASEGLEDRNQNGLDDYLEPTKDANVLTARVGSRALLQARPGFALRLGRTAIASGKGAAIAMADVLSHGNDGASAQNAADARFDYPTGVYDFEVSGFAAAGDSTQVVIPLSAPLPPLASYRKFTPAFGWQVFKVDAMNGVASAPGAEDACPAPGSSDYTPGLTAGDYCIELTLQDGGPNDADGAANGVVRDPGGAAVVASPPIVTLSALPTTNRTVTAGATSVVVVRFRVSSDSGDVALDTIALAASGSGNDAADVRAVKLWVDVNSDGAVDAGDALVGTGSYAGDNAPLQLQLSSPFALPMGDTDFLVTYDF